jgi:hypothetical protein
MNRRKLFSFLATSPVAVIAAVAQAKQPTEISVDRLNLGEDFEMVTEPGEHGESLHLRRKDDRSTSLSFLPPTQPKKWLA